MKVGIVIGSTRPGRIAPGIGVWLHALASKRGDADYKIVDVADFNLPFLDEPFPPSLGNYQNEHTKRWARTIATFDAFVFVTPEYNHGVPAALKNAIDFLYAEWANKVAGFVSYGSGLGIRAVEHLRGTMAELQIADVRAHVSLSLFEDFESFTVFQPRDIHLPAATAMFDQLIGWGGALKHYRERLSRAA